MFEKSLFCAGTLFLAAHPVYQDKNRDKKNQNFQEFPDKLEACYRKHAINMCYVVSLGLNCSIMKITFYMVGLCCIFQLPAKVRTQLQ